MTACSSILAMGMMPLCLLIYTSVWTSSDSIQIPYDSIGKHADATALTGLSFSLVQLLSFNYCDTNKVKCYHKHQNRCFVFVTFFIKL